MIFLLSIIMILCVVGIISAIFVFLFHDISEKKINAELNKKEIRSEEELMDIVFNILERKWNYRVFFHFRLKEITTPKFEFELKLLVNEIINSLSPDVLDELKHYYKDDEATIKTVSEMVQIYLLKYMDENNMKRQ